jgi:hypothetical protein
MLVLAGAMCALLFCSNPVPAAPGAAGPSGLQLTIELRDGSRVVGKSLEDTLSLHSVALGDMKLPWAGIRSIDFAGANTAGARLTAANGDVFAITLAADALRVETGFGQTELPVKLIRSVKVSPANANAAGADSTRLTIELRDGSRVAGKGLDDTLIFHAPAMGDLKLNWACIRSISFAGADTSMARLTATNGDVYEVQFDAPAVRVETSFGKTELPVKLIRSIRTSAAGNAGQLPSGLAALWLGDGSASDSAGENNGTLMGGAAFAGSDMGQAFRFDGSSGYVSVPHSPLWDFGNNPFTIAFWANFNSPVGEEALIADDNGVGADQNKWIFYHGTRGTSAMRGTGYPGNNVLQFHIRGPSMADIGNFAFSPVAGQWYHIALTRNGSVWTFYTDGKVIGTARSSISVPSMTAPLTIGNAEGLCFFNGLMREVSIYNRALSAAEIESIYSAGKPAR